MRFILGVLVGYSMRGEEKRLIIARATIAFVVYLVLPTIALMAVQLLQPEANDWIRALN